MFLNHGKDARQLCRAGAADGDTLHLIQQAIAENKVCIMVQFVLQEFTNGSIRYIYKLFF